MEVVVPYHFVVAQVGAGVCTACVQRFAVDRGLFAIATFYDGLLAVEHVADEEGGTSHVAFGDVDAVMPWVIPVISHPSGAWVDAVVLFIGVAIQC